MKIIILANAVLLVAGAFLGDVVLGGFGISGLMFAAGGVGAYNGNPNNLQA
ncbi:hypothetical protein HF209_30655 [Pseudomonas sp. WS 5096]|uniref:Protease HtpX n=1 Tax=Pseudomonas cremoris TaxID=2724178 RepID=A0ABR6THB1_9PSED|nr:hypothetical protein [Pseudomonas cremoris]MBC2385319.1 hypothetical protein [Pseudomonas cremoris]